MPKKTITAIKNGPFILSNIDKIYSPAGAAIHIEQDTAICRCGESMDMPFCDGMHTVFGFTDEKDPDYTKDETMVFEGKEIKVYFNRSVCSHRGLCFEELPEVFQMHNKEGGILPDEAKPEDIIRICKACPSGALSHALKGEERICAVNADEPIVKIAQRRYGYDGPLEIEGDIEFIDSDGMRPECSNHYVLCRCGQSKNMPFCSGEHWRAKFLDESNDEENPHDPLGVGKSENE